MDIDLNEILNQILADENINIDEIQNNNNNQGNDLTNENNNSLNNNIDLNVAENTWEQVSHATNTVNFF